MANVNVGIVGVGNCASSLVQGIAYYAVPHSDAVGLTHPACAGFGIADVAITSAFDVDQAKTGLDVSAAIWQAPNNSLKFAEVPRLDVPVVEGILSDGIGLTYSQKIAARGGATVDDIAAHLRHTETHVVVNFLPVGSQLASELYADAALRAGCAFVNCIPSLLARSDSWRDRFRAAGLPLVGDDLKSQFGSTLVHHALIDVLAKNGVQLGSTYQIVSGGNMDFLNMQDPDRIASKKVSKVQGFGGASLAPEKVHFGAEFVPFLGDRKVAYIRIEGQAFGGTPLEVEVRMAVEDSPSAAGNVLDAVRYARRLMAAPDQRQIDALSALLMKAPGRPMLESDALASLRQP